jgi:hypothetical protein
MAQEILDFLRHIVELEGDVVAGDEEAIAEIERIFKSANRSSLRRRLADGWGVLKSRSGRFLSRRKS